MKVLVIDDDSIMRAMLRQIIESLGDHVIGEAENGVAGIEASKRLHPDLALLDISMPLMGGFPAARSLKRLLPDLCLLFVSNHFDRHYLEEAKDCGASGFVVKCTAYVDLPQALAAIKAGKEFYSSSLN